MKTVKKYKGQIPDSNDGWIKWSSFIDSDNVEWFAFRKHQSHSDTWLNFKICSNGMACSKANYWFCFDAETNEFGMARDLDHMKNNRPKMYEWILDLL